MPRNSSGIATQPAGTAGVPNTTIQSTPYNNLVADVYNELTNSLPTTGVKGMGANLPMGGNRITGMADPTLAQDAVTRNYADTNYGPISGVNVFVGATSTGAANAQVLATTVPNTFTLTAGNRVVFPPGFTNTTAMTLAVNGLAAKNVFTPSSAGPVALVGGEVRAAQMTEAIYDGTQFVLAAMNPDASFGPLTNLASAATADLGTIGSHNINITGTTTITSFGSTASTAFPVYMVTFAAALTLTYNATSLILPGASNIVTAAGDAALALYLGSGNWRLVSYLTALAGIGAAVQGDVIYGSGANTWARLAKGTANQALLMNAGATAPQWSTLPIIQRFESSGQTITLGGSLTIAHGLGVQPKLYLPFIKCLTAENGYSIGDEIMIQHFMEAASNQARGLSIVPDATNLNVRFGNLGNVFTIVNKSSGAWALITPASWNLIVRAWA